MTSRDEALRYARNILALGMDDDETLTLARALIESEARHDRIAGYVDHLSDCLLAREGVQYGIVEKGHCTCGLDAALRREEVRDG